MNWRTTETVTERETEDENVMSDTLRPDSAKRLLDRLDEFGCVNIEGNREIADVLLEEVKKLPDCGFLVRTDQGYMRYNVRWYLKFWRELLGYKEALETILERFELTNIEKKKLEKLSLGERLLVQMARVSMTEAKVIFLEDALLNLNGKETAVALRWIGEEVQRGVRFVTVNSSMRHTLLLPGAAFYMEDGNFCQVEQEEEEENQPKEDEIHILKIAAKSENRTFLFEPKDIDFVESLNKCNYVSVRGTLFQVSDTMDEMERILAKSGFFRCHRSYIANMQRVEEIEKISKNSFALVLRDKEQSRIPLAKGRVAEMKETFGW